MARLRSICCAIDFSDTSRYAMEEAADLARALDAQLVLVHVHDTRPQIEPGVDEPSQPSFALAAVDLERDICAWRCEAEGRSGSRVRSYVLAGEPAAEIVRLARKIRVDVLVVGKHGRSRVEPSVLGSVADLLVRRAPCPVLVVREKELPAYDVLPAERSAAERRP